MKATLGSGFAPAGESTKSKAIAEPRRLGSNCAENQPEIIYRGGLSTHRQGAEAAEAARAILARKFFVTEFVPNRKRKSRRQRHVGTGAGAAQPQFPSEELRVEDCAAATIFPAK